MTRIHEPVMLHEVVDLLQPQPGKCIIDGTIGLGGHSSAILEAADDVQVLGIDRDKDALARAREELQKFESRIHLFRGPYSEMQRFAKEIGWQQVDGVLLDVGMSSLQIDTPERGFSYRHDAPLDMRMDRRSRTTAATLLNQLDEKELTDIFRRYGEERYARQIARAVVARREEKPWAMTGELAELIQKILRRPGPRSGPPAPTRVFQALRIAVNQELDELEKGLDAAIKLLKPGGRLVVISFHSLEDRIVKNFIKQQALECVCPPEFPVCCCDKKAVLKSLTKKPLQASSAEKQKNPRSSSAKLRAAEKLE